jgi:hypothetical protein
MGMAQDFLGGAGAGVRGYKEGLQAGLERALGLAGAGIGWGERQIGGAVQSVAEGGEAFRRGYEEAGPQPLPDLGPGRIEGPGRRTVGEFLRPPAGGRAGEGGGGAGWGPEEELDRALAEAPDSPGTVGEFLGVPATARDLELSKPEPSEMEALKESLGFEWATEVDPRTGRPAQPRTVNLAQQGEPEQLYTPPKEGGRGNVSVMSHPEQGQLGADTRTMSPTQLRAHFENLAAMAEAQRLGGLVRDPYAPARAEAGAEAEGKVAVERGKLAAETEATRERQGEYVAQLIELRIAMEEQIAALAADPDLSADEKDKREGEIRQQAADVKEALQLGGGMARRNISAREDLAPEVF